MLQKLCAYNNWANLSMLNALTDASKTGSAGIPSNCINLLSHIANAQDIWINRIQDCVPRVTVWQVHDLDTCRIMLQQSAGRIQQFLSEETQLDRMITYKTFNGDTFETAISDILLHVFNHGTYHRAQISKEMKHNDIEPINTDYIQFIR